MEMEMIRKCKEELNNVQSYSQLKDFVEKHTDFNNAELERSFMLKVYEGMKIYADHVRKSSAQQAFINAMQKEDEKNE